MTRRALFTFSLPILAFISLLWGCDSSAAQTGGNTETPDRPWATGPIIADHTVVSRYDQIPRFWIDQVKTMLLNVPGQSHATAYIYGLELLELQDPTYAVSATWEGPPEGATDQHLRVLRTFYEPLRWMQSAGEEHFWTNAEAVETMKGHLNHMTEQGTPAHGFGFGWCWDMTWRNGPTETKDAIHGIGWAGSSEGGPSGNKAWGLDREDHDITGNDVSMETYLEAVAAYNSAVPTTVTFFTTGPVDGERGTESGYQRFIKHEAIRTHVIETGGVLFDYADILCWNDDTEQHLDQWEGQTFQNGHPTLATGGTGYDGGRGGSHISEAGCLRLGKALWWMMARVAGWDGES